MCAKFTFFASPERASDQSVADDHKALGGHAIVQQLLDSSPEPIMVLNQHRQIVFVNDKLTKLLGTTPDKMLGRRPGEAFNCIHANKNESGCGTSEFCKECGAAQAICESQDTKSATSRECHMTCFAPQGEIARDLRVWATPLACQGQFTVFAVRDTSDEKRRMVLERLFFHDVLNTAGGLSGLMEVLQEVSGEESLEMCDLARNLANELVEEIQVQRDLSAAERGDLAPVFREVDAEELLERLNASYMHHPVAAGKILRVSRIAGNRTVQSDPVLLSRVLGNLIKNALEASSPGQCVSVSFENHGQPVFSVHNENAMPRNIQVQLFQRSFSTKEGRGRGVGTYSVKLLTEQYLHGKVAFTSSEGAGTAFTITLAAAGSTQ